MAISRVLREHRVQAWPWVLLLAFGALLAACSDDGQPSPTTVLIASERPYLERALELGAELLEPRGLAVVAAGPGEEPHITVGRAGGAGSTPFATGYWVVVTGLSNLREGITLEELGDDPITIPRGLDPPIEGWWGISVGVLPLPIDEIPDMLEATPDALALLPLESVDARVRSLPVDGRSIIFGDSAEREAYPIVERAWVSAALPDDADFALILDETKRALARRLALDYARPAPIILRATGDIIPARCVYAKQRDAGDFTHAFRVLGSWLSQADITVGSLDASISDAGRPFGCTPTFSLLAPAQSVEGLVHAGFDVITVATNHAKDCGQDSCGDQPLFDTLDILRSNSIAPVGGGVDLADARRPAIIDVRGTTFAFLGYDQIAPYYHAAAGVPGVAPLTEAYLREDIVAAALQVDVVVVLPQWGVEYTNHPTASQQALAVMAAEAGASLVIGNHPHWVQAVDVIDETYVAYALGNFVFDQDWSIPTQQGVVLEAAFHGAELKGVRLRPIRINEQYQPASAAPAEASEILGRIWAASEALP